MLFTICICMNVWLDLCLLNLYQEFTDNKYLLILKIQIIHIIIYIIRFISLIIIIIKQLYYNNHIIFVQALSSLLHVSSI